MITQKKDELLSLPPGVAYTLQPNQMVRLEMHYINATQAPLTLSRLVDDDPDATTYHDEANFLFIGNPDIKIPANSTFDARADLLQARPGHLRRRQLLRHHRPRAPASAPT